MMVNSHLTYFQKAPLSQPFKFQVVCYYNDEDQDGDNTGWTLIQRRGSDDIRGFHRNWNEYENGFGSFDRKFGDNFWLGLKKIHTLTKQHDQEIRIDLQNWDGEWKTAKYSQFWIADAEDNYRLTEDLGEFNGTAGDSLSKHKGAQFSTYDKDNDDNSEVNCAEKFTGGWWFGKSECVTANLNGLYYHDPSSESPRDGLFWWTLGEDENQTLKSSRIRIRRKKTKI